MVSMVAAPPADPPDSIEELGALVLLQKGQLCDWAATYEQKLAMQKQEEAVSEYSEEVSPSSCGRMLLRTTALNPSQPAHRRSLPSAKGSGSDRTRATTQLLGRLQNCVICRAGLVFS